MLYYTLRLCAPANCFITTCVLANLLRKLVIINSWEVNNSSTTSMVEVPAKYCAIVGGGFPKCDLKWSLTRVKTLRGVVRPFCPHQIFAPSCQFVVNKSSQILLNDFVQNLNLSIRLWMIGWAHLWLGATQLNNSFHKRLTKRGSWIFPTIPRKTVLPCK